ncbi:MAG: hypothetical protein R3B45_06335 [Bdellovibrionota bacterium]
MKSERRSLQDYRREFQGFSDSLSLVQFKALSSGLGLGKPQSKEVEGKLGFTSSDFAIRDHFRTQKQEKTSDVTVSHVASPTIGEHKDQQTDRMVLSNTQEKENQSVKTSLMPQGLRTIKDFQIQVILRKILVLILGCGIDLLLCGSVVLITLVLANMFIGGASGYRDIIATSLLWLRAFSLYQMTLGLAITAVAYGLIFKILVGKTIGFRLIEKIDFRNHQLQWP